MSVPKILLKTNNSKLWIVENFSPDFFTQIKELPLHEEPPIMIGGKECRQRRNIGFFSDESVGYKYSGQMIPSTKLSDHSILVHIITHVNNILETTFNGILVNSYINGEKYIGPHSDDERGLDKNGKKMVASICYGSTRTFRIRNKSTKSIVLDYPHETGTLLVMEGEFQKEFTHEIPKQLKIKEERISLTFRHHNE